MINGSGSFRSARHVDKSFYIDGDDRFYEQNYSHYVPTDELLTLTNDVVQANGGSYVVHRADVWTHVVPVGGEGHAVDLPVQGWKIHVAATNVNCWDILRKVATIAVKRRVQFKHANDIQTLRMLTSKRWTRGGSGKFITIYPQDVDQFKQLLETADDELKGYAGSFILSDRRYRDNKCLYYRYGSIISRRRMNLLGFREEILVSPSGEELIDKREPFFSLPSWVSDVFDDDDSLDGDEETTLKRGTYVVKKALAFSNTGGVYLAYDARNRRDVVIKEARPGVELGVSGEDATTRLSREAGNLATMTGSGVTPEVHDTFWDWENYYLVEEYLTGEHMRLVMLKNTPLLRVNATKSDSEAFFRLYKKVIGGLLTSVALFHDKGMVIGDLSPTNILYDEETEAVRIIDLEGAFRPGLHGGQDIHTPGFRARTKGRPLENNASDDRYAVGVIMLYSIFPLAALSYLRDDVYTAIASVIVHDVGWSGTPVLDVMRRLIDDSITCREAIALLNADATVETPSDRGLGSAIEPDLEAICRGLANFIQANYRPDDSRTLFPVDPFGQHTNPLGLGFGATGIVFALLECGFAVPAAAMERFDRELESARREWIPPGLINGSAGMAWGLFARGETAAARRLLDWSNTSALADDHHGLYHGLAGIGLTNIVAFRATGDQVYLDRAVQVAETLCARAVETERGIHWKGDGPVSLGYGYGQSGVALFLLRLSQVSGEPRWREAGRRAVEFDLSYALEVEPGVYSFGESLEETETLEQYIEQGSGGVAKVAIRYGMWDQAEGLLADLNRKYSTFPGLIYGLAGFVDVLTDAYFYSGDAKYLEAAKRPLRGLLDLYLFETDQGWAAPGENLFRISCDLATGTAGVMYALHRFVHRRGDAFALDVLDAPRGVSDA